MSYEVKREDLKDTQRELVDRMEKAISDHGFERAGAQFWTQTKGAYFFALFHLRVDKLKMEMKGRLIKEMLPAIFVRVSSNSRVGLSTDVGFLCGNSSLSTLLLRGHGALSMRQGTKNFSLGFGVKRIMESFVFNIFEYREELQAMQETPVHRDRASSIIMDFATVWKGVSREMCFEIYGAFQKEVVASEKVSLLKVFELMASKVCQSRQAPLLKSRTLQALGLYFHRLLGELKAPAATPERGRRL